MDKFVETYGERPDGHGGLPTMTTRAQDTWDALRAAYELGRRETEIDPHIDGVVPQPITYWLECEDEMTEDDYDAAE